MRKLFANFAVKFKLKQLDFVLVLKFDTQNGKDLSGLANTVSTNRNNIPHTCFTTTQIQIIYNFSCTHVYAVCAWHMLHFVSNSTAEITYNLIMEDNRNV
jgi:hypothetical protein